PVVVVPARRREQRFRAQPRLLRHDTSAPHVPPGDAPSVLPVLPLLLVLSCAAVGSGAAPRPAGCLCCPRQ
ncbi:hypothetical protein, partial [Streptomyces longispororuber]|uniref:hypothetical protein n=1 Tax=Streptomyces longispororuber TaxID=68230 RepID=UPI00210AF327